MNITKREILFSVIILSIMVTIGFFINTAISNYVQEKNEKYYKALKIDNESNKFEYGLRTNIGYSLCYGKVEAVESVVHSDIEGKYLSIRRETERYTMHTRTVNDTHTRADGTTYTTSREEVYYSWDNINIEHYNAEKFKFLNVTFDYNKLKFYNYQYIKTIGDSFFSSVGDLRYKYYTIPCEFNGTLFTNLNNNTINENEFYYNQDINIVIKNKQDENSLYNFTFWIVWFILIGFSLYGFYYIDNNWLEN